MELIKAIELLDDLYKIPNTHLDPDYMAAIKLGQEAAITIIQLRRLVNNPYRLLLHSETPSNTLLHPTTLFLGNRP